MSGFNLSALAVRERSVTLFLLMAIFIAGVVAFLMLGRAEDPILHDQADDRRHGMAGGDGEGDGRAGRREVGEADARTALV